MQIIEKEKDLSIKEKNFFFEMGYVCVDTETIRKMKIVKNFQIQGNVTIYMEEYNMYEYDDEVLDTFLKKQTQLFSEEVADTPEAAEEFLEDCMAVVCKNIKEVRDYFDEAGSDISGMSDDELMDQSEVFAIADGRFLVVEG